MIEIGYVSLYKPVWQLKMAYIPVQRNRRAVA